MESATIIPAKAGIFQRLTALQHLLDSRLRGNDEYRISGNASFGESVTDGGRLRLHKAVGIGTVYRSPDQSATSVLIRTTYAACAVLAGCTPRGKKSQTTVAGAPMKKAVLNGPAYTGCGHRLGDLLWMQRRMTGQERDIREVRLAASLSANVTSS